MLGFLIVAVVVIVTGIKLFPGKLDALFRRNVACKGIFDGFNRQYFRRLLYDNFVIYKLLDEKGKIAFEKRVCWFLKEKKFLAGEDINGVTDEMKLMIAAAAIQLTHGYPDVYLNRFTHIVIYADNYFSKHTGNFHQGEVNTLGAIVLSWKNLLLGFDNPYDGRNLLLHEMAHALFLSSVVEGDDFDFIDYQTMLEFKTEAINEMNLIENNQNSFFREYGSTNLPEFFSVVIECYFEQTNDFLAYNPKLYAVICRILKYDILNFDR